MNRYILLIFLACGFTALRGSSHFVKTDLVVSNWCRHELGHDRYPTDLKRLIIFHVPRPRIIRQPSPSYRFPFLFSPCGKKYGVTLHYSDTI